MKNRLNQQGKEQNSSSMITKRHSTEAKENRLSGNYQKEIDLLGEDVKRRG